MNIVDDKGVHTGKKLTWLILAMVVAFLLALAVTITIWMSINHKTQLNIGSNITTNENRSEKNLEDQKMIKIFKDVGINVSSSDDLKTKINEINEKVISIYNDPKYLNMGMDLDAIKSDIILQLDRKNEFIDIYLGWSAKYGYDELMFSQAYKYQKSLIKMMETGVMELPNNSAYSLEKQAAKIRFSVFEEKQFRNTESSQEYYDCLYYWFKQGHFNLKAIDSILLQMVDGGKKFDDRYYVSVQATILSDDQKYVAYLCPRISNDGKKEWTILDIMKEG